MKQLLLSLGCLMAALVAAQSYPVKPIEMISPTSAGGGSDLVARVAFWDATLAKVHNSRMWKDYMS